MAQPASITVIKNNHLGHEVFRYDGVILSRNDKEIVLEAFFNRDDLDLGYVVFRRGDRFIERYYTDRWYNIFEVHDRDDDHLKGWYCNFTRPAHFNEDNIIFDDLALDLWVFPDRRTLILDQDEFDQLPLNTGERSAVLDALEELQRSPVFST